MRFITYYRLQNLKGNCDFLHAAFDYPYMDISESFTNMYNMYFHHVPMQQKSLDCSVGIYPGFVTQQFRIFFQ